MLFEVLFAPNFRAYHAPDSNLDALQCSVLTHVFAPKVTTWKWLVTLDPNTDHQMIMDHWLWLTLGYSPQFLSMLASFELASEQLGFPCIVYLQRIERPNECSAFAGALLCSQPSSLMSPITMGLTVVDAFDVQSMVA